MGIVWFQEISTPPPRREIEILEGYDGGGEGSKAQEFLEGRGVGQSIFLVSKRPSIQYGFKFRSSSSKILSYLLSRSFTYVLNTCI